MTTSSLKTSQRRRVSSCSATNAISNLRDLEKNLELKDFFSLASLVVKNPVD